jgi:hypothetical protein
VGATRAGPPFGLGLFIWDVTQYKKPPYYYKTQSKGYHKKFIPHRNKKGKAGIEKKVHK